MAYSTEADVRVHAAGAPSGETFAVPIQMADGVIDAELRDIYDVPLETVDQIIVNISSKLAAAIYIEGKLAAHQTEESKLVQSLRASAMKDLMRIKEDASMLSIPPRERDADDDEKDGIATATAEDGVFSMNHPKRWG